MSLQRLSISAWRARWQPAQRLAFDTGLRAVAPSLVATAVWGLVTGVAMVKTGLSIPLALTMTLLVFAGSAQLTALPLIATGAPIWLVLTAATVVNLRFVIFSAALHPYLRHLSLRTRLCLGYVSSDIGFVVFMKRYGQAPVKGDAEQVWFFTGAAAGNLTAWQVASILGIMLGSLVPMSWSLEFAATLALVALVLPLANTPVATAAIVMAGLVGWIGQPWPLRLGVLAAVIAGIATGFFGEYLATRFPALRAIAPIVPVPVVAPTSPVDSAMSSVPEENP